MAHLLLPHILLQLLGDFRPQTPGLAPLHLNLIHCKILGTPMIMGIASERHIVATGHLLEI